MAGQFALASLGCHGTYVTSDLEVGYAQRSPVTRTEASWP